MESCLKLLLLLLFIFGNVTAYTSTERVDLIISTSKKPIWYLHAIEEDILHQNWKKEEKPCLERLLKLIKNVHNSTVWATWIWDSMQFPMGVLYGTRMHLGNYDQCMNFPWKEYPEVKTQYCLAELYLSELDPEITEVDLLGPVQNYIRHKTKHNLRYNELVWGVCMPVACKPESISKFVGAMLKSTYLGQMEIQVNITVNSEYCQIPGQIEEKGLGENLTLSIIIFFITVTVLCTCYISFQGAASKNTVLDLAKAFDIKANARWLLKTEDQSIRSILGIRMISIFLILLSHQWIIKNVFGISNAGEVDKKLDDSSQCIRFNADLVVDTFFMLSGLLLVTSNVGRNPKSFNIFTVIAKRYIRLMCPVVLVLLMLPIVLLRGETAPLVKKYLQVEVDTCATSWWRTILMIANYGDSENMCYVILWSMASDFHLFVIGTLVFWTYLKNKKAGIKVYLILTLISMVLPIMYGYIYNSPPVTKFDFRTSDNIREYPMGDTAYVYTHLRAGPYFVGMAYGYLLALYRPAKHRNIISKKLSILTFVVFLTMYTTLVISTAYYHEPQYSSLEGALFLVIRRNGFAALVGFLIIICEYTSLPYISDALSWSGLVPFSKLSYGVYLTHFMILLRFKSRTRVPFRSDAYDDIYSTIGLLAVTSSMSFFMWLFWEAPIVNLFDKLLKRSSVEMQKNKNMGNNEKSHGE